jgi:hypothetical protein
MEALMSVKYWVGSNMPGYMPDSEPFGTEDFELACQVLKSDLELASEVCDIIGDEDAGDDLSAIDGAFNAIDAALKAGKTREFHVYVANRHFYLETY